MIGQPYSVLLKECGFPDEMLATMSEEDCEAEYIELYISGV